MALGANSFQNTDFSFSLSLSLQGATSMWCFFKYGVNAAAIQLDIGFDNTEAAYDWILKFLLASETVGMGSSSVILTGRFHMLTQ